MTCQNGPSRSADTFYGLPTCIQLTDAQFSVVTASFTIGGLIGSLFGNSLTDSRGRKGAIIVNTAFVAAGSALMTIGASLWPMVFGRY